MRVGFIRSRINIQNQEIIGVFIMTDYNYDDWIGIRNKILKMKPNQQIIIHHSNGYLVLKLKRNWDFIVNICIKNKDFNYGEISYTTYITAQVHKAIGTIKKVLIKEYEGFYKN